MHGWRVMVVQDDRTFLRDELKLFMGYKDDSGTRMVQPIQFTLGEVIPPEVNISETIATTIPQELAEELLRHLAHMAFGTSDLVSELQRLRTELGIANSRINKLIDTNAVLANKVKTS